MFALLAMLLTLWNCDRTEPDVRVRIEENLLEWVRPFSTDGEITNYISSTGEETTAEVLITSVDNLSVFADCQIDGQTRQCQYASAAIEFAAVNGEAYNLSVLVSGKGSLWIMPAKSGGITTPILVWNEIEGIFNEGFSDLFTTVKVDDFVFEGNLVEAFIILQDERNLISGQQVLAPKRAVLVEGIGFVEWEDFSDITYSLQ